MIFAMKPPLVETRREAIIATSKWSAVHVNYHMSLWIQID
jgi:hypothetical protein